MFSPSVHAKNCDTYRIVPIKGATPNKGAPYSLRRAQAVQKKTKIATVPSKAVRCSIQNRRWKAENLSFYPIKSYLTLLERPAPLIGTIRYIY